MQRRGNAPTCKALEKVQSCSHCALSVEWEVVATGSNLRSFGTLYSHHNMKYWR
jgi:hypothetical protein